MSTVTWKDLPTCPDSGHGGVFQHHEEFVPEVLAFLNGSGESPR